MSGVTSLADGDGNSEVGEMKPSTSYQPQPGTRRRKNSTSSTGTSNSTGGKGSSAVVVGKGSSSQANVVPGDKGVSTDKFFEEAMAVRGTKRGRR